MIPFKDISYAQGAFNMDTDPDQIVAMKASGFYTESHEPYLDSELDLNYSDAIRLHKVPILYHFAGGADPTVEADYFVEAVSPLAVGDVYALDWEIDVADPVSWVVTFINQVHAKTGVWPLVYMDISRLNSYDWTSVFSKCGLWAAAPSYGFSVALPVKYTVVAQQGPIVNEVDSDMWFGTLEELVAYGYKEPAVQTPTLTPPQQTPVPLPVPTPPSTPSLSEPAASPEPNPVTVVPLAPATLPAPTPNAALIKASVATPIKHNNWFQQLLKDLLKIV